MMTDRRFRQLIVLTVLIVWAVYFVVTVIVRGETPEKWTWGIAPGVYAALFRPRMGKASREREERDDDDDERRPARRRPAGDG